jgi:hypothetical protein
VTRSAGRLQRGASEPECAPAPCPPRLPRVECRALRKNPSSHPPRPETACGVRDAVVPCPPRVSRNHGIGCRSRQAASFRR